MNFKDEQFKLGRLFGFMNALNVESDGYIAFDDWIDKSNEQIDLFEPKIKPEMLGDLMELYCGNVNVIEIDNVIYCFVGGYQLIDDELDGGFGIVCINEGKFLYYNDTDFMEDVIKGDDEKLDILKIYLFE